MGIVDKGQPNTSIIMRADDFLRRKPVDRIFQEEKASRDRGLRRRLGALDLTTMGIGAIIGTGIFVLTGVTAARFAGPAAVISFLLAGIAAALAALVYAELAAMVPVAGSAYVYSYASLGEFVAWIVGWDLILEYTVAAAAVAIGWSGYLVNLLESAGVTLPAALTAPPAMGGVVNLPALVVVGLVAGVLILGTRESAIANNVIVLVKLGAILLFLFVGALRLDPGLWVPFAPFGIQGVVTGAAIVFFAYIGFDAISTAAEEVKNPGRDLPLGILGSLAVSSILYVMVALTLTGLVSYRFLNVASPLSFALLQVGAPWASAAISVGALVGLSSVILVNIFGQSRVFFAMSRDGLLPPCFVRLHPRYGTPHVIILLTASLVALIGGLLPVGLVAELANIGTLGAFVLVSVGVIVLRYTHPELPRPFRVPLFPAVPILSGATSIYLMLNLPAHTWVRFLAWLTVGLIVYVVYGYRRSRLALEGRQGVPGRENPALASCLAPPQEGENAKAREPSHPEGEQ
jgi:APA family basic amino acid/polyamine antiporter